MVKYETTLLDLETGAGGVYQTTVASVPVKSSKSWIWKTIAAISLLTLCAAAAVFFTWHVMELSQKDIPHFLSEKQISTPSEQGRMLKQIAERTKAAIHLHGKHDTAESKSLKWVSGVDQSFEQGGLKLADNMIHIPADGLYFVYSQVSYAVRCSSDESDDNEAKTFLSHSIWRYTDAVADWKPLQNSAQSVCQSQEDGKTTYSTIYLGAVFKLMEGDKLETRTRHFADIEDDYAKTFFGVFAL
ncbi:tumor necrosis factor b (TNF superfamily, member 2) [Puntigrus tetrazona]|uniref:tumor necrosis factor b (TNF superfamily, member 2) n=1 Tax=Puntigrus tetrazona TaxID=1606681 RepID=UPI001C8910E4|nr:tumor necrosis factor b (TNF superfamily, member 2) [Puntigrus tetrazona]